jgi:hypothetical protein
VILLSNLIKTKKFNLVFFCLILIFTSILVNTNAHHYQTDLQVGETLVYKKHNYNYSNLAWEPWYYLMYEITSIVDTSAEIEKETIVKAAQWISNDSIQWKQIPFYSNHRSFDQNNEGFEVGIISRLQEIPIHHFSGFHNENLVIRSDIKIGDMINEITKKINNSLDEEDWLGLHPINDGFGLSINVKECGCSIEGGTSKRIRNITYSTRGILDTYYFSERVDYGADAEANQQKFEFFLIREFNTSGLTLENLSSNWNGFGSPLILGSSALFFFGIPVLLAMLVIFFWRKKQT